MSPVTRKSVRGLRQGKTQTGLLSYRDLLESWNFEFRKKRYYSIEAAKTKALIRLRGCAGWSAPLLFAEGINRVSRDMAHIQEAMAACNDRQFCLELVPRVTCITCTIVYHRLPPFISIRHCYKESSIKTYVSMFIVDVITEQNVSMKFMLHMI